MGKTRDFKKIRDTKGTFHAKMGSIKDRNGMDLTEADAIKKRWQEYTEDYTKKGNAKECSNYCTIVFISHVRKLMFKILQGRLRQYTNRELPSVLVLNFEEAEELGIKLPTVTGL